MVLEEYHGGLSVLLAMFASCCVFLFIYSIDLKSFRMILFQFLEF